MKNTKQLLTVFAIAAAVVFYGCKGKDGAPGATGPAGTNGTNGNANVTAYHFTIYPSDWHLSGDSKYFYSEYITQTMISDNASVMVYSDNGSGKYLALPFTTFDIEYYYQFASYGIEMDIRSASGNTSFVAPTGALYFKAVVIPPALKKAHPSTNWNDYNETMKALK